MRNYTITNPGCYHSLLSYLSQLSGLSTTEVVKLDYNQVFRTNKRGNRIGLFSSYNIDFVINGRSVGYLHKQIRKGNVPVLTNGKEDFPYDVDIDHFLITRNRGIYSFGIDIIDHGKSYNDSIGNGWYSKCRLYQVNDQYFAMMDCTC